MRVSIQTPGQAGARVIDAPDRLDVTLKAPRVSVTTARLAQGSLRVTIATRDVTTGKLLGQPRVIVSPNAVQVKVGAAGIQGAKGDKGDKGDTGAAGPGLAHATRAVILAETPVGDTVRLADDTRELAIYTAATGWLFIPWALIAVSANPDIGLYPFPPLNQRLGYGEGYVSDKEISNCTVGGNPVQKENGFWVQGYQLWIRLAGMARAIVAGFRFRERQGRSSLEHQPTGFETWIDVTSGDSLDYRGLNGDPIVHGWTVDIGAFPSMTPCRAAIVYGTPVATGKKGCLYFDEETDLLFIRRSNGTLRKVQMAA